MEKKTVNSEALRARLEMMEKSNNLGMRKLAEATRRLINKNTQIKEA